MQQYEKEHLSTLRALLPECVVLLKSNGDFPLQEPGEIALYGSGARNTIKGGTGSGEVNSRYSVSVEQGLINGGFEITTGQWLDAYDTFRADAKKAFIANIKKQAKQMHVNPVMLGMGAVMPEPEYTLPLNGAGQTAVYVLSRISGEGNDRKPDAGDILLSQTEIRDILALYKQYQKFLLVINAGGPVDLTPVLEVENIMVLSQLGVDTGSALSDLLLGKAYPSGKLATTWITADQLSALGEFGDPDNTRYHEGIYVGYRYFDSIDKRPLFSFGFGLGYTTFDIRCDRIWAEGQVLNVTAAVTNTGKHPGKEVVQLYVSVPFGKLDQPWQTLAAFEKTGELLPGAAEKVTLSFSLSQLASFDTETSAYILEQGNYILRLGNSSNDTTVCGVAQLDSDVTVKKVRHIGGTADITDWKPEAFRKEVLSEEIPVIYISSFDIPTETVTYDGPQPVDEIIQGLTDEELAQLNVGSFDPKGNALSIIGNASKQVAGAAGESTGLLKEKGIPAMIMADGPAGLRLSREYVKDGDAVYSVGQSMPETILDFMPKAMVWLTKLLSPKPPKKAQRLNQYATAIPIGTAIAQSWNRALAYACGDIVGSEMERFGVHLWLAPALNIHRDIRCGRNFEYLSEDPLISGILASQITKGVQSHPGRGVTLKHYAANNQETNRYSNNSIVSERALRELYLRGFGLCVELAQPCAVMTSYNLLNGIHTSECRDLSEDYLRSEYGFTGIFMTDWLVAGMLSKDAKHPAANAARIAAAGGDLVMPGSQEDYKEILTAVKEGTLDRHQLLINATRVYRMSKKLAEKESVLK